MADFKDPRFQSDFSSNKGVDARDNPQIKPGAKDSVGSESNNMVPLSSSMSYSGPFGGENQYKNGK